MDGIDFDILLDDTQLPGSFLPADPVIAGSSIMEIPQTDQGVARPALSLGMEAHSLHTVNASHTKIARLMKDN